MMQQLVYHQQQLGHHQQQLVDLGHHHHQQQQQPVDPRQVPMAALTARIVSTRCAQMALRVPMKLQ
jgi:hypothetical protein